MQRSRRRDLGVIIAGYLVAAATAATTVSLLENHPLIEVLIADVIATVVIFAFSVGSRNSSFYDPYWSVAPPLIVAYLILASDGGNVARQVLVAAVVLLWAVRLTANWVYGWQGLDHEDWRYRDLARRAGRWWWPLSFAGVHLFPTIVVWLGCIALYPALAVGREPLGWLDAVALVTGLAAVWLEYAADRSLHRFRAARSSRSELLATGIWAWCRHPNYLGEIGFWLALFLFGMAAWGGVYPWSWLGPVSMSVLFLGVSIPMIETRLAADKPAYAEYRRRTRMLVPGVL